MSYEGARVGGRAPQLQHRGALSRIGLDREIPELRGHPATPTDFES
jgi:hypothetical protein